MNSSLKEKILEEIMGHLDMSSGEDLKALIQKSKAEKEVPEVEGMEDQEQAPLAKFGKPKGIEIEKLSVLGKPKMNKSNPLSGKGDQMDELAEDLGGKSKMALGEGSDEMSPEMSDDELKELISKYL